MATCPDIWEAPGEPTSTLRACLVASRAGFRTQQPSTVDGAQPRRHGCRLALASGVRDVRNPVSHLHGGESAGSAHRREAAGWGTTDVNGVLEQTMGDAVTRAARGFSALRRTPGEARQWASRLVDKPAELVFDALRWALRPSTRLSENQFWPLEKQPKLPSSSPRRRYPRRTIPIEP